MAPRESFELLAACYNAKGTCRLDPRKITPSRRARHTFCTRRIPPWPLFREVELRCNVRSLVAKKTRTASVGETHAMGVGEPMKTFARTIHGGGS
jgi:hypothetical protein